MGYLDRYAEPEAKLAVPGGPWDEVVAVPVLRESELLDGLIASLETASRLAGKKTLAILVVNHRQNAPEKDKIDNRGVLSGYAPSRGIGPGSLDCFWIDRASDGRELGEQDGVGTARKIGCDLATALKAAGRVSSEFGSTTDGDARVEPGYFLESGGLPAAGLGDEITAYVHRFRHGVGENETDLPLTLYEIYLRHYVLGLRAARSPYAFHTVGSLIRFRFSAYAETRGFPKREAGEDFYLLDKLAKLGRVAEHQGLVHLVPRPSDRVPFGTGAAMSRVGTELKMGKVFRLFPDSAFRAVGALQQAIAHAHSGWDEAEWEGFLVDKKVPRSGVGSLKSLGFFRMTAQAAATRKDTANYRRHVQTGFGALKTFQWIRLLAAETGETEYRKGLIEAPFVGFEVGENEAPLALLEKIRSWEESHAV